MTRNTLTVFAALAGGVERVRMAQDVRFTTQYPAGLFGNCSFFVPRDLSKTWHIKEHQRVSVYDGVIPVWDGNIISIADSIDRDKQGSTVTALGLWGDVLMMRQWRKPWVDALYTTWKPDTALSGYEYCQFDQSDRLYLNPNGLWVNDVAAFRYDVPFDEPVVRVKFDYNFRSKARVSPDAVVLNDAPAGANTFTDLPYAYDNDATSTTLITITSDDWLYIGKRDRDNFAFVTVTMGATVNANAATLSGQYWNGTTWGTLFITVDGTAVGSATLAQTGDIGFTKPTNWADTEVNSTRLYWIRLKASANLTGSISLQEINVGDFQSWTLGLYNNGGTAEWSTSTDSSATTSVDVTLSAPTYAVSFRLKANGRNIAPGNGTVRAKVTALQVYTETGAINLTEIAKDVRARVPELSTYDGLIGSCTYEMPHFVSDTGTLADILTEAARFGDASGNAWNVYIREGVLAPDGKPVLCAAQVPSLTDYDYTINPTDDNLINSYEVERDISGVRNFIDVTYYNPDGSLAFASGLDYSVLKDTASIANYGERHEWITVNTTEVTKALAVGARWLAQKKDPQWRVSSSINVKGYIRGKGNVRIPSCRIRAGNRIRLSRPTGDLTLLVTGTEYSDNDQVCNLSVGVPDTQDVWLAKMLDR